jgi:predicted hydrocarbon binding protein
MINIANLAKERSSLGNYFAPDAYVKGEFEFGLIENRHGSRLLALPTTLLQAIYSGLEAEVGTEGSGVVMFNCGRWWGKSFFKRFAEEIGEYYGKPIAQMEVVELIQCVKQCWKTHGWGILDINFDFYQRGFIVANITNSAFAAIAPQSKKPTCFFESGILSAFFSQLSGRTLHCVQVVCESTGAEHNTFVIGLAERLEPVEAWREEGHDYNKILELLCGN